MGGSTPVIVSSTSTVAVWTLSFYDPSSGLTASPSQPRPRPPDQSTVTVGGDGRQHAHHRVVHLYRGRVDSVVLRPLLGSDGFAFPAKAMTA